MKILVLGAGVVGVSTAYILAQRGHEVEILDRGTAPASETSFANGGQLSFSHAEPWATPKILGKALSWMFKKDAPLVFKFMPDAHLTPWLFKFVGQCNRMSVERNSINLLRLGIYSKSVMEKIRDMSGIDYDNLRNGILHTYTCEADFQSAIQQAKFQNRTTGEVDSMEICFKNQVHEKEPALQYTDCDIVGGIYCPMDESGSAHKYTINLAKLCMNEYRVTCQLGHNIEHIETKAGRITGVKTDKGTFNADAYVMALGSYSYSALKQIGIRVPIYPMKGYSITFPKGDAEPTLSVTDNEHKVVVTRLGDHLRAAGTAELNGYNTDIRESRIAPIIKAAQRLYPNADFSEETLQKWACLRASTPDGLPIIGKSKYDNLYLNIGHGTLGWTQAAGTANLVADVIDDHTPEISLSGLTIERYS